MDHLSVKIEGPENIPTVVSPMLNWFYPIICHRWYKTKYATIKVSTDEIRKCKVLCNVEKL